MTDVPVTELTPSTPPDIMRTGRTEQVQPPNQIEVLKNQFLTYERRLQHNRTLLQVAQDLEAGVLSQEQADLHALLHTRMETETLDEIIEKSAANVRSLNLMTLQYELPYRKMEAEWLMHHPHRAYPARDVIEMVRKLKNKEPVQHYDPLYLDLTQGDKSLVDHENEAKRTLERQLQRKRMIHTAQAIQDGRSIAGRDPSAVAKVRDRLQNESTATIIQKLITNLVAENEGEELGSHYRQTVLRIHDIENELGKIRNGGQKHETARSALEIAATGTEAPLRTRDEIFQTLAHEAKARNAWVARTDMPIVPPGFIRIYRGIKPNFIQSEFGTPPTKEEIIKIQEVATKISDRGDQSLTPEEKKYYEKFDLLYEGRPRFFADSFDSALKYAQGGAVLVLDIPARDAHKYYKDNGLYEFAFRIPFDIAEKAQYYAVGPKALENNVP